MTTTSPNVQAALATLRDRWGGAAPHWGGKVEGALAMAPQPAEEASPMGCPAILPAPLDDRAISTGFGALDAILGLGGLPRAAATALHGE